MKSARVITSTNRPIQWISPAGLPCIQPYVSSKPAKEIKSRKMHIDYNKAISRVDSRKQSGAFPPNFVHSLDASHMMMTANRCCSEGINYISVHDSYWCHGCDVDRLNVILKEEFVKMYSTNILEDLRQGFLRTNYGIKLDPLPDLGNLDIKSVLDSDYFFS